jgi:hypothetical protein
LFNPKLYELLKINLKLITTNNYNLTLNKEQLKLLTVKQSDNQLFRLCRIITGKDENFVPYIVFIDASSARSKIKELTRILKDGFYLNDIHFVSTERSASMSRNGILGFIDERIQPELDKRISMDMQISNTVISKYSAYRGLMFSSCHFLEGYKPYIIVVDDYINTIENQSIKYVVDKQLEYTDKETGETKPWLQKDIVEGIRDIDMNVNDGAGLCTFEVAEYIRNAIGIEQEDAYSFMIRLPYIKGVIHTIDFKSFYKDHAIFEIKDIWGEYHYIDDVDIILTKSQYKCFGYFKNHGDSRDYQEYWKAFDKYEHVFGVSKWNYSAKDEPQFNRVSYQILQDLDLEFEDFIDLADYSLELIESILNGDNKNTYCFMGLTASNKKLPSSIYARAVYKNEEMLNDKCVREYLYKMVKKIINDFKCGKIYLPSSFRLLCPDLIFMMEFIGGLEPVGALEPNEFWSKSINGQCLGEWLIERNPHICASEHTVLNGTANYLLDKYCSHFANVCMINSKSITNARLNGADFDGDLVLVLKNNIMVKGVHKDKPVVIDIEDKILAKSEEYNIDNIIKTTILSMDNRIGNLSNVATCYHNKKPSTEEQKEKYLKFIDLTSILTGKEIDYSKTNVRFNMPRYISKYSKPLPHFMKYNSVYYSKQNKFSYSQSNMNRLCRFIEKWEKKIRYKYTIKTFDANIMIDSDISWDEDKFNKIEEVYFEFNLMKQELSKQNGMKKDSDNYKNFFGDLTNMEIDNTHINWQYYYDIFREKCKKIVKNPKELANYAVFLCYFKYPKRNRNFCWIVSDEGIIENIPETNFKLPVYDINGDNNYLGKKYFMANKIEEI